MFVVVGQWGGGVPYFQDGAFIVAAVPQCDLVTVLPTRDDCSTYLIRAFLQNLPYHGKDLMETVFSFEH